MIWYPKHGLLPVQSATRNKRNSGGSADVSLWDVASGQEKARLKGHLKSIYALVFSPDERLLASGSDDQSIIIWSMASGKQVVKFTGFPTEVFALAFTPDGKYLFAGGDTEVVFVYNMLTNKKETELWLAADSVFEMLEPVLPAGGSSETHAAPIRASRVKSLATSCQRTRWPPLAASRPSACSDAAPRRREPTTAQRQ